MEYISYKWNQEKSVFEILVDIGTEQPVVLEISKDTLIDMANILPALKEQKLIEDVMVEYYRVMKEQALSIEQILKDGEKLEKLHEDLRKELSDPALDKNEIMAMSARSKDLGTSKVILDTKRHLLKMGEMTLAKLHNRQLALEAGFTKDS
jgi:hypothetical protein